MANIDQYFDAVLNENYQPIFNGTPEETKAWVKARLDDKEVQKSVIMLGKTLTPTSIQNYIAN